LAAKPSFKERSILGRGYSTQKKLGKKRKGRKKGAPTTKLQKAFRGFTKGCMEGPKIACEGKKIAPEAE